jgi:hypothetical protein
MPMQCRFDEGDASMSKHFEDQIVVRVAKPLRDELESAARADGRPLASQVRKILTDFAAERILERSSAA